MRIAILITACLALLLTFPLLAAAQNALPPADWEQEGPHTHAETVLEGMVKGDHDEAFKLFFSRGRYPKNTLEKIRFDYYQLIKQQGRPTAFEKVFEQRAGTAAVRLKYILLFKSQPMMFDLYYYDTGKGWLLKSFTLSRDIKKIFAP